MPEAEERRRGGVVRYRTKKLKGGRYMHVAVVRKRGPKGGRTLARNVRHSRSTT